MTQIKSIYYPQYRVLEDLLTGVQTQFALTPNGGKDVFKLIQSKAARKQVRIRTTEKPLGKSKYETVLKKENRWLSIYRIKLGDHDPFDALIVANHEGSTNTAAYRILNDADEEIDFVFDTE